MKTHVLKKLIASIIVGIGIFFFFESKAQIVYTDVIPDQTCNTDGCIYSLDLNNDGTNDFTIKYDTGFKACGGMCHQHISTTKVSVKTLSENGIVDSSDNLPSAIDENNAVNSSLIFDTANNQILADTDPECSFGQICIPVPNGHWSGVNNKYLGLRILVGSNHYYGWARLDVAYGGASFTIKDYAYNSIPDSSILAGDTGGVPLGISTPISENSFSVSPNPASNKITLPFSPSEKKEIQITNTLGQIVFAATINSHKEEINLRNFPRGIYLVTLKTDSQTFEKKFLKE